ncbi:MAG: hypothetical protein U9N45_02565 [Gemmatimonadota bacterium]|nr:hypothetical protein [Gemmatimonadota bacterium]
MSDEISLKKMFAISILLHLFLLLIPVTIFIQDAGEALAEELKQAADEDKLTFIFVETPEEAEESSVEQVTPFISDRNLAAVNPTAPQDLPAGMPFQEGISDIAAMLPDEFQGRPSPPAVEKTPEESLEEKEESEKQEAKEEQSFDALRELEALSRLAPQPQKEKPFSRPAAPQPESQPPAAPSMPRYRSPDSRAPMGADFQLSTYAWNWAPYLKELKKRIESNIYPPPAFYMGMVRGRTFLRFKIQQDGSMTGFELIGYAGHESLMNTSVNSIEASVPFLPLPSDFPDDFLGITVGFYYNEFLR